VEKRNVFGRGEFEAEKVTFSQFGTSDEAKYKYAGGVYIGEGKVVAIPYMASQPLLIDLGPGFRSSTPLNEQALLSAWFNKF